MIEAANKGLESIEVKRTGFDGKAATFFASNAVKVHARVAALRQAADEAHTLRFVADQSEIGARLDALLASLPQVEKPVVPAALPEPAKAAVDIPRFLPHLKGNQ